MLGRLLMLLCFADAVHGSAADRTHTLGSWLPVLEGYLLGILYLPLCPAFEAVGLYLSSFGMVCISLDSCEAGGQDLLSLLGSI